MSKLRKITFPSLLILLFTSFGWSAKNYPKPVGFVNDFAGILSAETKNSLESKLRDYKEKTSIEVAVVTVPSLEEETIEEYTIGLAQSWGVGDKEKDNGIVFLIAPNDRQMRIEAGYGLEADLTDAQADSIIRNKIKPLFKEGKMNEGIVAGVDNIISTLKETPFEARAEERRLAEEKRIRELEIADRKIKNFFATVGKILLLVVPLFIFYLLARSYRAKKKRLESLHVNNFDLIRTCQTLVKKIDENLLPAKRQLETIKSRIPEEQFSSLQNLLNAAEINLPSRTKDLATVMSDHLKWGWKKSDMVSMGIENMLKALEEDGQFSKAIEDKIIEAGKAETISQQFLTELPRLIESVERELQHPDVSKEAKKSLDEAKTDFEKAKTLVRNPRNSWLIIFPSLFAARTLVSEAEKRGNLDKIQAKRARKEGPELLVKMPNLLLEAERATNDSDVSVETKKLVQDAKAQFKKVKTSTNQTPVDWPVVFPALLAVAAFFEKAKKEAEEEIKAAKKEREEKNSFSYSSGISISGSGSGGGGFGGFSGGSFGGGGASGSW